MPSLRGRLLFFDELTSTNDTAKELARSGGAVGRVVVAERQTAGRGRMDRRFVSPAGWGIYATAITASPAHPDTPLTALTACAVCRTLETSAGCLPAIKWVNDILLDERKICGILCESVGAAVVIGVGINVNNPRESFLPDLPHVSSLSAQLGKPLELEAILVSLVQNLDHMAAGIDDPSFRQAEMARYRKRLVTLGRRVRVIAPDGERTGLAVDLAEDGALLVDFGAGAERVIFGDVSIRGMEGYL
jgi:BirA family biotin operon repressor/biotin-[acetyl-CoA-carboxylase] ligase